MNWERADTSAYGSQEADSTLRTCSLCLQGLNGPGGRAPTARKWPLARDVR